MSDTQRKPVQAAGNLEAQSLQSGLQVSVTSDTNADEWDDFVRSHPGAELYHLFGWQHVFKTVFQHQTYYLAARDAERRIVGVLPLVRLKSWLFGDYLVSLPCFNYAGLLARSKSAKRTLLRYAEDLAIDLGVSHIEFRHKENADVPLPCREDKVSMVLDLPASDQELWRGLTGKVRAQIRRPTKEGASCRQGGIELVDDFYRVLARNWRDLGMPIYPARFFHQIMDDFSDSGRIAVVDLAGKPVAAGLTLDFRSTVEIPWAASLREMNRYGVNMLLYWTLLKEATERGSRRFDFGRSTRDSGTYKFKRQWGADPVQLRWHYWLSEGQALPQLTPNNPKYAAAIACWRKLPVPIANMIGPHVVRNLP